MKKKILSGIQPTGDLHIGNYFGAVQNWVRLQDDYECLYCVVDYHSMTMPYKSDKLRENTWKMAFYLLPAASSPKICSFKALCPNTSNWAGYWGASLHTANCRA